MLRIRFATFVLLPVILSPFLTLRADERPNIVWIVVEDQSRHYGCYGELLVDTPAIDALAAGGVKFTNAMVTAPVCSAARSALVTGMWQTSIGAHHHRSGRGELKIHLPEHVQLIPKYFQDAGYYTSLGSIADVTGQNKRRRLGKSDYNFEWEESVYNSNDWRNRKPRQPFFAQIMLLGGKARKQARSSTEIPHVKSEDVKLPPYYPRHPVLLEDWAAYLDTFTLMDREVATIVERLKAEKVFENTVIFFLTDHGVSHARGKQFCYDEGIMVPLIVHAPERIAAGEVRDDLVAHIDVAASSLHFAGIPIPKHLEARTLFGDQSTPRKNVVSARDRCDETYDQIRSVRTKKFKYIRNGYPQRPHLQPNVYKDQKEVYHALREWHGEGKLSAIQEKLLFRKTRPVEELYDLNDDPRELNNLASNPRYTKQLKAMRGQLDEWIAQTRDQGQQVESMQMFDSDMAVYLYTMSIRKPERVPLIKANIALMKKWWSEKK